MLFRSVSQSRYEQDAYSEKSHAEAVENAQKAESAKDANIAQHQKTTLEYMTTVKDMEALQKELKKDGRAGQAPKRAGGRRTNGKRDRQANRCANEQKQRP